eukprot:182554-Pelagomonas_calceolata.AAC.2
MHVQANVYESTKPYPTPAHAQNKLPWPKKTEVLLFALHEICCVTGLRHEERRTTCDSEHGGPRKEEDLQL